MTEVYENATDVPRSGGPGHDDYLRILEAIQTGALQLLAGFQQQPAALRFHVGDVTIEAEWQVGAAPMLAAAPPPVAEPVATRENTDLGAVVRAPSVGVFYRRPEPGTEPFVEVGDRVNTGQQIAIVEATKLMIPVHAQASGMITAILKEDNEPVQFDEPLFSYSPE
ncbi:MAG: acetyl-CoA carboxylase biotin carboxyl carrier protein subunit [Nocardia sp.]|uniref:acetyl-CoA carboxylase biotin carboxyl carrier protein n=1 Tax=Nocardia sp. TaxID=1821 RepID=UPI0026193342|nr:biotin/lipoyl-containing protein [Nocardia sp.]MCU1648078.1 acetyl-CoA carboxylase biotin carboxyl carrier protein subunit [Nocardia sp.]